VIQTGSIAAVAFIYGDYANQLVSFGPWGAALHGASAIIALTGLNMLGTHGSKRMQVVFAALTVISLLAIVAAGVVASGGATTHPPAAPAAMSDNLAGMLGMGMVFVLLTYGGWNEAAYLSGELRDPHRNMARVLLIGTVVVTTVYLLANLAYLHIFGLQGLRDTGAVGAALMRIAFGEAAAVALSLMVCIAALSTMNATILTGARVYYALGHDIPQLSMLASWSDRGATPTRALLVQGIITFRSSHRERHRHDGGLHRTGVLAVHVPDRPRRDHASRPRSGPPPSLPHAALSAAPATVRGRVSGSALVQRTVRRRRGLARPGRARCGRAAAADAEAHADRPTRHRATRPLIRIGSRRRRW
jgi:hypothetical protein